MTQPDDITASLISRGGPLLIDHLNDSPDFSRDSLHHTLGIAPTQASPGNHTHLGDSTSKAINQLTVGTSKVTWDGSNLKVPGKVIIGPQDGGTSKTLQFTDGSGGIQGDILLVGGIGAWASDAGVNDMVLRLESANKSFRFSDDSAGGISFISLDRFNGLNVNKRAAGGGIIFPAFSGNSPGITGPVSGQSIGFNESAGHFFSDATVGDLTIRSAAGHAIRFGNGGASPTQASIDSNGTLTAQHCFSVGSSAGFNFADRVTATGWEWYAQSGQANLWNGSSNVLSITLATSLLTHNGSITLPVSGSTLKVGNSSFAGVQATNQFFTGSVSGDTVILQAGTLHVGDGTNYKPIKASAFTVSSSLEVKQHIEKLKNSLGIIRKLQPMRYEYRGEPGVSRAGFIAEDVVSIFPEAVSIGANGPDGIHYGEFVPLLVGALHSIDNRITQLEGRVK